MELEYPKVIASRDLYIYIVLYLHIPFLKSPVLLEKHILSLSLEAGFDFSTGRVFTRSQKTDPTINLHKPTVWDGPHYPLISGNVGDGLFFGVPHYIPFIMSHYIPLHPDVSHYIIYIYIPLQTSKPN